MVLFTLFYDGDTNCKALCSVTTLNVIPYVFGGRGGGIIDLQWCNYYHLPSDFSSNFQSSMTIFHRKLLTREGRVLANGWTLPSSMTIFVHLFIESVIQKITIVTLNMIWHYLSYLVQCIVFEPLFARWEALLTLMHQRVCCIVPPPWLWLRLNMRHISFARTLQNTRARPSTKNLKP